MDLLLGPNQHETCLIQMSQVRKSDGNFSRPNKPSKQFFLDLPVGVKCVCLRHLELGLWQAHLKFKYLRFVTFFEKLGLLRLLLAFMQLYKHRNN